jgi:hypothetical protein
VSKGQAGPKNGMWKGGRTITKHGYVLIRVGKDHPLADVRGYAYEHRIVASKKLGRTLGDNEIVHHVDGNTLNNDPSNLEVVKGIFSHAFLHRKKIGNKRSPGEQNPIIYCECGCGSQLLKYDSMNRPRRFITGHNMKRGRNDPNKNRMGR